MVWPIETYTTKCSDSLLAGTYPLDVVYAPHPHGRPTHHDDSVSLYESLLSKLGITDSETCFGNVRLHPIVGTALVDPIRWTDDHVYIIRRWWCEGSSGTSYECPDTETYRTGRVDCGASCLETIQTETRIVHITQTCLLPCTLVLGNNGWSQWWHQWRMSWGITSIASDHIGKCVEHVLYFSFNFVCSFNTYILVEKCPMYCIFWCWTCLFNKLFTIKKIYGLHRFMPVWSQISQTNQNKWKEYIQNVSARWG